MAKSPRGADPHSLLIVTVSVLDFLPEPEEVVV